MKSVLKFALLLIMSVLLLTPVCQAAESSAGTAKVVAKVNDSVITEAELNRELDIIKERLAERGRPIADAQLEELRKRVLDGLVNRDLLYSVCLKDGVKADEKEVEKAFQMVKARYADDDAFQKMLQKFHLTEDYVKQDIAREMSIKKMIDSHFAKDVAVTDEEAKEYYETNKDNFKQPESVKASHILIKVSEDATPEVKAKAKAKILDIKKKIDDGADFGEMAKKYSEGPSAANSGDLGYFRRGQMVKPFEDAAFALKPGQVSDVVETKFGYHLIKLVDKKEQSVVPFEQVKSRIVTYLKQDKLRKAVSSYIDDLRSKSTIQISKVDQAK